MSDPKDVWAILRACKNRLEQLGELVTADEDDQVPKWVSAHPDNLLVYQSFRKALSQKGVLVTPNLTKKDAEMYIRRPITLANSYLANSAIEAGKKTVVQALIDWSVYLTIRHARKENTPISKEIGTYIRRFGFLPNYLEKAFPGYQDNGMILLPLLAGTPDEMDHR